MQYKAIFHILFIIICAFSNLIILPNDYVGYGKLYVLIPVIIIALITGILYSVITFLIFKKANHFVGLLICVIAFVLSFYNEQQKIRSHYDELSMNDYSLNSSPQANMINNTIIHKFDLSKKLYIIRYLDLSTNQELASYPICITQRKIMYDREFLHQIQKDSIFTFTDKVLGKDVQFKIQPLKQDTISYSYYYQVKNGNQREVQVIVANNNPKEELENVYGKLMKQILDFTNPR